MYPCEGRLGTVPVRDIVGIAIMNGARALGLEQEIGSLKSGKAAEIIFLDLSEIGFAPPWSIPVRD